MLKTALEICMLVKILDPLLFTILLVGGSSVVSNLMIRTLTYSMFQLNLSVWYM